MKLDLSTLTPFAEILPITEVHFTMAEAEIDAPSQMRAALQTLLRERLVPAQFALRQSQLNRVSCRDERT